MAAPSLGRFWNYVNGARARSPPDAMRAREAAKAKRRRASGDDCSDKPHLSICLLTTKNTFGNNCLLHVCFITICMGCHCHDCRHLQKGKESPRDEFAEDVPLQQTMAMFVCKMPMPPSYRLFGPLAHSGGLCLGGQPESESKPICFVRQSGKMSVSVCRSLSAFSPLFYLVRGLFLKSPFFLFM